MTVFARFFSRAQARFRRVSGWLHRRVQSGILEDPMVPVPMLLSGLLSEPKSPMATTKVAVTSLNVHLLVCKSQKLIAEGERMNLELRLPEVGPLHLAVVVDWVNISSVAHSLGLRVVHKNDSRRVLEEFCNRLRSSITA